MKCGHADIPHQDVIFLDETIQRRRHEGKASANSAFAGWRSCGNAINNATGVRVRDYPITLDKLIDRLPRLDDMQAEFAFPDASTILGGATSLPQKEIRKVK